jgi:NAD(P)-dependent dehydrogenase (short-subunit alcohol dehydrogenase family)
MSACKGAVVVTGGSRGIGRAAAILLAQAGYEVLVTYLQQAEKAEKVVAGIQAAGGRAMAVKMQLPEEDVAAWFTRADEWFNRPLVGLVNNAAYVPPRQRLVDADLADWRRAFEVNVLSIAVLCREAFLRMAKTLGGSGGSIVNVSSQVAAFGAADLAGYSASKGAVNALTLSLAREFGSEGVRVNAVSPGLIVDEDGSAGDDRQRSQVAQVPLGRLGEPSDVGELIAWLISSNSAFVTGTIIPVHGGR